MHLRNILSFIGHYKPGYKAGGPIRSVENMVATLHSAYRFKLVCYDRDLGDQAPYPSVPTRQWIPTEQDERFYIPPAKFNAVMAICLARQTTPAIYHMHNFYKADVLFALLIARAFSIIPDCPILITPHGNFSEGALRIKWFKKWVYLRFFRLLGFGRKVWWQLLTEKELNVFLNYMGKNCQDRTFVIPNIIAPPSVRNESRQKRAGSARFVFLARVSKIKNLLASLRYLKSVRGEIKYDIYGPLEEKDYWQECQALIKEMPSNICVTYHGSISHDQVGAVLSKYEFYVFPSKGEGFSMSLMEALSAGLPVIGSDKLQFDLTEKKGGWSLPLADEEAFTRQLQQCVEMTDEEYQRRSCDAVALAMQYADTKEISARYSAMFEHVISEHAAERKNSALPAA